VANWLKDVVPPEDLSARSANRWAHIANYPTDIDSIVKMLDANESYTPWAAAVNYNADQIRRLLQAGVPLSLGYSTWVVPDGQGGYRWIAGDLFNTGASGANGLWASLSPEARMAMAQAINSIAATFHTLDYVNNTSTPADEIDFGPFTGTGVINNTTGTGVVNNTGSTGQETGATQETTQKSKASPYVPPPFRAQSNIGGYQGDPKQSILGGLGGNFFAGQTNMIGALGNTNPNTGGTTSAQTGPFAGQTGNITPYNIMNSGVTQGQNQTNPGLGDAAFNLGQAFNTSPAGQSGYVR